MVCTGGPKLLRPPSKSVRPPRAVRLVSAFNAPGFDSNCASGIADANVLDVNAFDVGEDEGFPPPPPLLFVVTAVTFPLPFAATGTAPPLPFAAAACSCVRFAFCSSTLWDKRKDRNFVWLEGYFGWETYEKKQKK